jgi:hypothetical protein
MEERVINFIVVIERVIVGFMRCEEMIMLVIMVCVECRDFTRTSWLWWLCRFGLSQRFNSDLGHSFRSCGRIEKVTARW